MKRKVNWSVIEQASFLKRVGELLLRGYSLAEAIQSLSLHLSLQKQIELRKSLAKLQEGHPFHQILAELRFNRELVNYVYFAEQHGGLAEAIIEGSAMVLKRDDDFSRLKKLIAYPGLLMMFTGILFYFVDSVLLPKFTSLHHDMNVESNVFTQIVSSFSTIVPIVFYLVLAISIFSLGYYLFIFRKYPILTQRKMLVQLPFIGKPLKLLYSQNLSVQLSYLVSSGMSIMEALNVFEKNKHQAFSSELGKEMKKYLSLGLELDSVVKKFPFFESELCRIIKHGQDNGKLDQELFFYSRHCLTRLEESTERGLRMIQPVLYSFIGLLIVSLYLAILLPMFELIQGI